MRCWKKPARLPRRPLAPLNRSGDEGRRQVGYGVVTRPPVFKQALQAPYFAEGGAGVVWWQPLRFGGLGMSQDAPGAG